MQDLTLWSKLSAGRNLWTSLRVLEALLAFGSWMACLVLSLASKRDSLCLVSPVIHFHVCLGGLIAVHKQNLILIFLYRTVVEFEIFHLAKFYYQKTNTSWFLSTDVDIILDVRCFTMRKCAVSSPFCNRAHCQRRMHWPSGVLLWHLPLHVQNEWLSGSWVKMALKETHPSFKRRCQRNPSIHPSNCQWQLSQLSRWLHPSSFIIDPLTLGWAQFWPIFCQDALEPFTRWLSCVWRRGSGVRRHSGELDFFCLWQSLQGGLGLDCMMEDLNMKSMKFLKFLSISNWCSLKFRIPSSSISLHVCSRERCRNRKIFRYPNTLGHTHTHSIYL